MTIAYFDCFSGISGDMTLGALLDLGLPLDMLTDELAKLNLKGYSIATERKSLHNISGTRFVINIETREQPHHRSWADIENMIKESGLCAKVKKLSIEIFSLLASAEAKIHGQKISDITFHEIGAVDSIIDIVGVAVAFNYFNFSQIHSSALRLGSGFVKCRHGVLPLPAPATLEILAGRGVVDPSSVAGELTTPTGAAIIASVASSFGSMPPMHIKAVGYGAGSKEFEEQPNFLRIITGEPIKKYLSDEVMVVESNIDDMNPQLYENLIERLFGLGALDVTLTPIQMKKQRPAVKLTVICRREDLDIVSSCIFEESTSIGLRYFACRRHILHRRVESVDTPYGKVEVKLGTDSEGNVISATPEYEDVKRLAHENNVPVKQVLDYVSAVKSKPAFPIK
jgi:uncharacterized protein (TIGR00299 family) protein